MQTALILAGLAAGIAAAPHCAAMCGAPCASLGGCGKKNAGSFHLGRLLGYMAGGAAAAASVSWLKAWSDAVPALRPLWTMLHLGFLALGLWWLVKARQPAWITARSLPVIKIVRGPQPPWRSGLAGLAWVAWPCGALQTALMLAALGNGALEGAWVMAAYAVGSLPGLVLAPAIWSWASPRLAGRIDLSAWGLRGAGLSLALASAWALGHGLWGSLQAWCGA